MNYIPVDLYRGSFSELVNSSILKNPNALSIIGDRYVFVGEDLYVGSNLLLLKDSFLNQMKDINMK